MRKKNVGKLLGVFAVICALVLIMAPAALADAPVGSDRIFNGRTGAPAAVAAPASADATTAVLTEAWVATTGSDTTGDGTQTLPFQTIQKGLDAVDAAGTVYVYPGTYSETASGRYLYDATGPYQFGLFFADEKGAVTLQGVKADGTPITAVADVAATVNTNATNNYGPSGFWVEGDGVTIAGIRIGTNSAGQNKTVEVIGENFTLKNCDVADTGGSIYLNDWRFNDVTHASYMTKYSIVGNTFASGVSLDIASGVGVSGAVSGRVITGNTFASANGDYWPPISFSGADSGVPWFEFSVGGAIITGNTFTNADPSGQYIRARGTYEETQFDWASYWNDNTFDKGVVVTTDGNPANVRTYSYPNSYGMFNNVRRIGAVIQGEVDHAAAGDTILVKAGTYVESGQIVIAKNLSIVGADRATTIIKPTGDTGSSGDARGWFLVNSGVTLNMSSVTLDGQGKYVHSAIRTHGNGTLYDIAFQNIVYSPGSYDGRGVSTVGDAAQNLTISNSTFSNIGRIGVLVFGATATISGNTYTGKGPGDWLDYGFEAGGGGTMTVTGNTITDCEGVASVDGSGSAGILATTYFAAGTTATAENNVITGNTVGVSVGYDASDTSVVTIHKNDLSGNVVSGVETTAPPVNAENNWWGSACGPAAGYVSANVDFDPWWTDVTGSGTASGDDAGGLIIAAGASTATQNAILSCAPPGSTVTYAGNPAAGGVIVTANNVTIDLGGATVGAGSPAYTIVGDDITLENGILDGDGDTDNAAGVLVQSGADNFTLNAVEIKNWRDGVEVTGSHASLKLVNNWLHDNSEDGFQFNSDVALSGVITINGNLFKFNTGSGIRNDRTGSVPAQYNSWGAVGGPASLGDGSANVDADPFSFVEIFTDANALSVVEDEVFDVNVKVEAAGLYAVQYKLTYDPTLLVLQGIADGPFKGTGSCATNTATAGIVTALCTRYSPDPDVNAAAEIVSVLTFKADPDASHDGEDAWTATLDLSSAPADLYAGARDGIKVWVNNGGFGDPSVPARDITDTTDGTISIAGLAQYTGYIDLQGRTNDSLALLSVYDAASTTTSVLKATATSAASGAYVTAYASLQQLSVGGTYYFQVDRDLYLPTTRTVGTVLDPAPTSWADFKLLSDRPNTVLGTVVLLGGDATNDNAVDVLDAGAIGGAYGTAVTCGAGACTDVTGDGKVDILDLTLMGGNYNKTSSPWTE